MPDERWAALADAGFDAVWLMGVWTRSAAGSAIALDNTELVESFQAVLPDYRPEDVVGSPYCVRDYQVDPRLGGRDGLARARAALARHGLGLILDFVPNHVAPDHPWTRTNPELFVRGSSQELEDDPGSFVAIDGSRAGQGSGSVLPGVAGRRAAQRIRPRPARQPSSTRSATSPSSATECGATWRC